jgi:hypothetical protein
MLIERLHEASFDLSRDIEAGGADLRAELRDQVVRIGLVRCQSWRVSVFCRRHPRILLGDVVLDVAGFLDDGLVRVLPAALTVGPRVQLGHVAGLLKTLPYLANRRRACLHSSGDLAVGILGCRRQ